MVKDREPYEVLKLATSRFPIMDLVYPQIILHKNCFQFLLCIAVIPKVGKNNFAMHVFFLGGGGGEGKLPTSPSPNLTCCSKLEVSANVGKGEG